MAAKSEEIAIEGAHSTKMRSAVIYYPTPAHSYTIALLRPESVKIKLCTEE
jgi:hypothetical protein